MPNIPFNKRAIQAALQTTNSIAQSIYRVPKLIEQICLFQFKIFNIGQIQRQRPFLDTTIRFDLSCSILAKHLCLGCRIYIRITIKCNKPRICAIFVDIKRAIQIQIKAIAIYYGIQGNRAFLARLRFNLKFSLFQYILSINVFNSIDFHVRTDTQSFNTNASIKLWTVYAKANQSISSMNIYLARKGNRCVNVCPKLAIQTEVFSAEIQRI